VAEGRRVAALAEYARLAKLRYDEGYASYIEVLDAQRTLFDAELQYVAVQGDVYASLIGAYKAMGGGWITAAQRSADQVDFPPAPPDSAPRFDFPTPTSPTGAELERR
jgi:multidrug efflux system outer membrane protein